MSQFQLFPPPSQEPKVSQNPFRKGSKKSTVRPRPCNSILLEQVKSSSDTEAILLRIVENTNAIQAPSRTSRPQSPEVSPQQNKEPSPTEKMRSDSRQSGRPKPFASSSGLSSSSTLVEDAASSSEPPTQAPREMTPSPVVAMKSMFPRYNPKLPLNQQKSFPQQSGNASRQNVRRRPEPLIITPPPEIDSALGPLTVPPSAMNFSDVLGPVEIHYSSTVELTNLWEAANGQRPQDLLETFNLRMARTDPSTFTFGDPQHPFYSAKALSSNEISLTRADPSKPHRSVPVIALSLEDRSRRERPNDGLVTMFLSRLAAMLAIDQAKSLVRRHRLAPTDAVEVEENALRQAASQETCQLLWNQEKRLYELRHPALSQDAPPSLVGTNGIPLSPTQSKAPGSLHITVSTASSDKASHQPPTILVTTPASSIAIEAATAVATPRTSTLPVTDSDGPLASLDFRTMTLSISPALIIFLMPSLYAIDSVVAAILAVAVSDEITKPILAEMVLQATTAASNRLTFRSSMGSSMSKRFTGKLFATLAEREDAEEESKLMSQIRASDRPHSPSTDDSAKPKKSFWPWHRSSKLKSRQIVVEEFDLEKYGRYGRSSSREGEKLPGVTRTLLRLIFWTLELAVAGLTLVVKIIAWLLVNVTRALTSEKS